MCFIKKNGQSRYKYLVLGRDSFYFVKKHSDSTKKFSETDIINILKFFIDNIFVMFGGSVSNRQSAYIWVQTVLILSLTCFFIPMRQEFLKKNEKKLARSFNFTLHYTDDVLSLNNSRYGDFVDRIYPIELEIKDTTDTDRSASYLDLHLEIDSEWRLRMKLYDKRNDFNFPIVKFPLICSNIPTAPAYGVNISQLIRYSSACGYIYLS